jgi:AcrR family transcriptional regulator
MALTRTPRSSWIDEGLRALASGGADAVRIESLAKTLGVTKGGFYWHFTDRAELLSDILDTWERLSVDDVIDHVEGGGGDAKARTQRLFNLASTSGTLRKADLAVRDWARRDHRVARRLRRVDNRRMNYMRTLFGAFCADADDIEVRCMTAMALFVGSPFIAAEHGERSRAEVLALTMQRLLE